MVRTMAVVVATLVSGACSSGASEPSPSSPDASVTTSASDTAPSRTSPTPNATTDATEPEVDRAIEGTWVVAREVTIDRGFFGTDQHAEVRQWDLTCADPTCTEVELVSSRLGVDPSDPVTASWDGRSLAFREEREIPCFESTTNDYTGPPVTRSAQEVAVDAVDAAVTVLRGTNDVAETTPVDAPDTCDITAVGYSTDVVMFAQDRVPPIEPPVGTYRGGAVDSAGGPEQSIELRVGSCDGDCDVALFHRVGDDVVTLALSGSAPTGYLVSTHTCAVRDAELQAYDVGEPVIVATFVDSCDDVERTTTFVGRIVPDPVDTLDPRPAVVDLPELDDEGRVEVRETVVSAIQNAIISVGDAAAAEPAILATYPSLAIAGPLDPADPRTVSLVVRARDSTQPASEANPWIVAFAVMDTSGGCLGGLVIGFPAPRDPLEITDLPACTAQAVYDRALVF
jgi:hypothetical protein